MTPDIGEGAWELPFFACDHLVVALKTNSSNAVGPLVAYGGG